MGAKTMKIAKALVYFVFVSLVVALASAQTGSVRSRITQPIDESKLMVLRGNTHPFARPQFDRGAAPANLSLDRMMLVLKTTPEQGAALNNLLAEQQDRSSPNYHKWLTPQEFGAQFGVADADIQKITAWLESHGFHVDDVANGRNVIQFSGNAAQLQSAFHTAMHKYAVNGKEYWANANDPAIPVALTPAVTGVASLNNFPRHAAHRLAGTFTREMATGKVKAVKKQFTYAAGCQGTTDSDCYALGPNDFATIYNVLPLWNAGITGTGQTIAIVSDSDVNPADFTAFRSLFGLPAGTLNRIYGPGSNSSTPGVLTCASPTDGDECEADIDMEWSGAVAPGATIDLVISEDTDVAAGTDLSAQYVIDGNVSPKPTVIGYSYGTCEFALGSAGNAFYGGSPTVQDSVGEWKQAAAEGITVVVSTGDNGSTDCEEPSGNPAYDQPAEFGLAVNGIGSTPYNVSVGGTDFNDPTDPTTYWNSSGAASTQASVKSYIPEITYNDSCTNLALDALVDPGGAQTAEAFCNIFFIDGESNPPTQDTFSPSELVVPFGGGGGPSTCINSDIVYNANGTATGSLSSCTVGYSKPTWQTGTGVPNDGKRDLPDVAFFAGDGTIQNFYSYCEADADYNGAACSLTASVSGAPTPYPDIQGVGGTSVAAEVFVGTIALLNQQLGASGPVGLPNQNLYTLAGQSWANCQSGGALTSACIFYQVTSGNNSMPCVDQETDFGLPQGCTIATGGDTIGTTVVGGTPAYTAAAGYNMATGLGSLNVYNLVTDWNLGAEITAGTTADYVISASPTALTLAAGGGVGNVTLTTVPLNGFTDTVTYTNGTSCTGMPANVTCSFVTANGSTTATFTNNNTSNVPPGVRLKVRPLGPTGWTVRTIAYLACALAMAMIFVFARRKNRRWSTAAACVALMLMMGIAACGGGSSSSNPPPPPPPPPNVVQPVAVTITGTSATGHVNHTTTVMLTVD
jgi:subtilase family serine protease